MLNTSVKSKVKEACVICHDSRDHLELICGNHLYCAGCVNQSYEFKLSNKEPITNTCTVCNNNFHEAKLKGILSENIKSALIKFNISKELKVPPHIQLLKCPACVDKINPGLIMSNKDEKINQFYICKKESCLKEICLYCLYEVKNRAMHDECKKYYHVMEKLEKILHFAIIKECPKCKNHIRNELGAAKLKDASCTHIRCNKCNMNYCYICGGHEETIDKNSLILKAPIFRHNDEWDKNSKRCPMYIRDFSKYILDWPKDECEATFKLEKYKISSCVNRLVKIFKFDQVKKAYQVFSTGRLNLFPKEFFENEMDYLNFITIDLIENKIFSNFDL